MHLDKLLSWDDMRDSVPFSKNNPKAARIAESQFFTEERHDLLARLQILELNELGEYGPVEVAQTSELDSGTFQLHQGLQRRVAINLTHSSGDALPWDDVVSVRVSQVQLLDPAGKTPDMTNATPDVSLKLASKPVFRDNANGTRSITVSGQWDSSLHNSLLLDRVTADKYRVQMTVSWEISSEKLAEPMKFSMKVYCQIMSRTFVRQTSMLSALWQSIRFVHSASAIFTMSMRPAPIKRVGDLWRMNSQYDYVKGEENLASWRPRGVSLVSDYISARKKRRRITEIGAAQTFLKRIGLPGSLVDVDEDEGEVSDTDIPPPRVKRDDDVDSIDELLRDTPDASQILDMEFAGHREETVDAAQDEDTLVLQSPQPRPTTVVQAEPEHTDHELRLLKRCLKLWAQYPDPTLRILSPANTDPPANGLASEAAAPPSLITTVISVPKNPTVMKGGYLLVPSNDSTRWIKRFVELRRPYLHIHNATDGDEVAVVSLRNARVDSQPGILGLLESQRADHHHGRHHGAADDGTPNGSQDGHSTGAESDDGFRKSHRRTSSGRLISTIWTGTGGSTGAASKKPGLQRLSDRLQAGVFAIYGTDNTWLFAARSERDKLDWIVRIDQSFMTSGDASGAASPRPGAWPRDEGDDDLAVDRAGANGYAS